MTEPVHFTNWHQALAELQQPGHQDAGSTAAPPDATPTAPAAREVIAAALYEHANPGRRWADAHPDDRILFGADADAVLAVILPGTNAIAALARQADADMQRVIGLYERWVKAGPPPLGTSVSRWWDTRLVELRNAICPPQQEQPESSTERPGLRERHRAKWAGLTDAQRAERIAALDADDPEEK